MKYGISLLLAIYLMLATPWVALSEIPLFKGDLDVGVLLCLTGNCADWGSAALKGAELATKELNASGGVLGRELKLHVEDTRESISGAQAVSAFQKLTALDKFHFIIGPSWSPGALAIAPLAANKSEVLVLTPSASAQDFNRAGNNLFNMRPVEDQATIRLAQYAVQNKWTKAAVLTSSQAAEATQGQIFKDAFTKAGGKVVRYIETNPELPDLRTEVLQIVASKPDLVFLMSYNQINNAANNLRALGFAGQILAISIDESRISAAAGALENVIVAKASPPTAEFVAKFKAEYQQAPGLSAENGYDAVLALVTAIRESGSFEPPVVAKKLATLRFSGAAGELAFNAERGVVQAPVIYRIKNGAMVTLE